MSEANRVNPPNEAAKAAKAEKRKAREGGDDVPIDPATGEPYKSGEVPLGKNEPVE